MQSQIILADFYAGMAQGVANIDIRKELQSCILPDEELYELWDSALVQMSLGNDKDWTKKFSYMIKLIDLDLAPCLERSKLSPIGAETGAWLTQNWMQIVNLPSIISEAKVGNKMKVTK